MRRIAEKRSRAEWARLIRRWRASGKSAEVFAAEIGVSARSVVWWSWRLAKDAEASTKAASAPLQLVPVHVAEEPVEAAMSGMVLEFTSARGDRLRVTGQLGVSELRALVAALVDGRVS